MSNAVIVPLTETKELVITTDNHGAIGEKAKDTLYVPNTLVGYSACRVAMMELLAASGTPETIVLQNFTSDEAWSDYKNGVLQVLKELEMQALPITGSTETNFSPLQSALGLTIIGMRDVGIGDCSWDENESFAIIGTPLVGQEVIDYKEEMIPLCLFHQLCQMKEVKRVLPVGSKGIASAWRKWTNQKKQLTSDVHVEKSAGPSTCVLIAYRKENESAIRKVTGNHFHPLYMK